MDKRLAMREWGFMIPVNGMIVICFAVGEFLAGALIGAVAAKIAFGSRLGVALAIRAGWLAGFAFVILATLAGWAGSHSAFYNGGG